MSLQYIYSTQVQRGGQVKSISELRNNDLVMLAIDTDGNPKTIDKSIFDQSSFNEAVSGSIVDLVGSPNLVKWLESQLSGAGITFKSSASDALSPISGITLASLSSTTASGSIIVNNTIQSKASTVLKSNSMQLEDTGTTSKLTVGNLKLTGSGAIIESDEFNVNYENGRANITATSLDIEGGISASSIVIETSVSAKSANFTASITASSASISDKITAKSGDFSDRVSAFNGFFQE